MATRHAKYVQSKRELIPNRIEYDLLMAIALDTGDMDEPVVAGYTELSKLAGCHRNSVGTHIERLREAGWLKIGGTDQKRVYYLEGIVEEEEARGIMDGLERRVTENHHNVQRGLVTLSKMEPSQIVTEVAQRLSQIAVELSQIVTILATVTNQPSQRPEGACDGSAPNTVDHNIYNNINNNNYYDPPVTKNDTRDGAMEGITLFQQLTGLFPPHDTTDSFKDHWLQPMTAIVTQSKWDMDLVEQRIREAIKIARGDNPQKKRYPIASPKSILTIALNWEPGQEQPVPYNPIRMVQV